MKYAIAAVLAALLLVALANIRENAMAQDNAEDTVVRHVVIFKFKDAATPEQIKTVENDFAALPGKISQIQAFEWGTNISPESLAQGYTHCFVVTFKSEADRDAYIPHPAHKQFASSLGPVLDKVLVIDYKTPQK